MATRPTSEAILHLHRTVLLRDVAAMTDEQLLEGYINRRDDAAMAALVQRHALMVWGVCRRVLHNYHDVEDAFQATFLVLVRKASSIASRELLANWLYGVAHQTALNARTAAARRKERESQVKEMPEPEVSEQAHWPDLQPLLDQELSRLPDRYRVLIVLCDLEGKTRKEAAEQLGCPEGTVAGRLARARGMLAKRLARHGLGVSAGVLVTELSQKMALASVPIGVLCSTIKAADVLAAGHEATDAVTVKVAALTEGVLKAMRVTKLKIATAALFVATTVALTCEILVGQQQPVLRDDVMATPQIKPTEPQKEGKDRLQVVQRLADEPKYKPIDAETIAAYKKLGARFGVFIFKYQEYGFVSLEPFGFSGGAVAENEAMQGLRLPGFFFKELPEGKIPKLPPVNVPFGLSFEGTVVLNAGVDAGLKELKDLKNLTVLDLSYTQVTDKGLKELKDLKNLTSLKVGRTQIGDAGLKELKDLTNLSSLSLGHTKVGDAGLKELKDLKDLTWLFIQDTQLTDKGLKEFKDHKNLTILDLSYTKLTHEGMKELKDLKNLNHLDLDGTPIGDAGLKELKDLKNLHTLYLSNSNVTDVGLKELKDLKNLHTLYLKSMLEVTDAGLKELKGLTNLSSLSLYNTEVGGVGLRELKDLENLTYLDISASPVTDEGLKELKDLKNLKYFYLGDTRVTDEGLKELKDLKNLNTLDLGHTRVGDAGMKELKNLKNLGTLYLRNTQVTDVGMKGLKNLDNLSSLYLEQTKVGDEGLKELKNLKNLSDINLSGTQVTDAGLKELKDLKNLKYLILQNTQVGNAGLKELKDLKNLKSLKLAGTQVGDEGLKELKNLKNLDTLILQNTLVGDAGLKELKNLKKLTTLFLSGTVVTDAGVKELQEALPKCQILK